MSALWTEQEAAKATGGHAKGAWQASRVEIDSRRVQPGDLFVAIRGDSFDGHDFVKDALAKGAVAALVSKKPEGVPEEKLLVVADALRGLEDLGREARRRCSAKVVGVTGSVGKTSTKEMLRMALAAHGQVFASSGNFNNHIGTPLNLANLPPDAPFAVFEMGMNHAGEISHLTTMVQPHVAAITTVEAVHSEFFDGIEGIADAKAEIFEGVPPGGAAVLNRDNPQYAQLMKRVGERNIATLLTFGAHEKADCRLVEYKPMPGGCAVTASVMGREISFGMKAVGRHWAMTALLVLGVGQALGLDAAKTATALSQFGELAGRGSLSALKVKGGEATLIDDSYNASPAAMRAAFAKTKEVWQAMGGKGRKIAALGNMLELGADAPAMHSGLAEGLKENGFDALYTAGELMQHLHHAVPEAMRAGHVAKAEQLLALITPALKPGDVLLVKGSHGSNMYELAAALAATAGEGKKHAV